MRLPAGHGRQGAHTGRAHPQGALPRTPATHHRRHVWFIPAGGKRRGYGNRTRLPPLAEITPETEQMATLGWNCKALVPPRHVNVLWTDWWGQLTKGDEMPTATRKMEEFTCMYGQVLHSAEAAEARGT